MKSLFPCHLRPREPSAMLLTDVQTHTHTHTLFATHYLAYFHAVVGIKAESPLITSMKEPPGDKHLTGY